MKDIISDKDLDWAISQATGSKNIENWIKETEQNPKKADKYKVDQYMQAISSELNVRKQQHQLNQAAVTVWNEKKGTYKCFKDFLIEAYKKCDKTVGNVMESAGLKWEEDLNYFTKPTLEVNQKSILAKLLSVFSIDIYWFMEIVKFEERFIQPVTITEDVLFTVSGNESIHQKKPVRPSLPNLLSDMIIELKKIGRQDLIRNPRM